MDNINEILGRVTDFLKTEANTETVVGKAFELGEFKCVPVIKIGLGFGYGSGEGTTEKDHAKGQGGGAGAGIGIEPIGFLVNRGTEIMFVPSKNSKGLTAMFEKVPELLEKYFSREKEKVA